MTEGNHWADGVRKRMKGHDRADGEDGARGSGWLFHQPCGGVPGDVLLVEGVEEFVPCIFAAIGGQEAVDNVWSKLSPMVQAGTIGFFTGLAAGSTGIVLLCIGNGNMRKTARMCDAAGLPPSAEVVFGPTPSGVGFALRF